MASTRELHAALVARIVEGPGHAEQAQRRAALDNNNAELREPLATIVSKVALAASSLTDEDISRARAAGASEDQLFELIVCAAVGQASRQYAAGIAALDAASAGAADAS